MRKNIVLFALLLTAGGHPRLPIRFNPRVGSTYHYDLTSETTLTVKGSKKDVDTDRKSSMAVNYGIKIISFLSGGDEKVREDYFDSTATGKPLQVTHFF
jgi:hypothetical protein